MTSSTAARRSRRQAAKLAKLTPPNPEGLVPRHRLFRALDRVSGGGAAWISGPGGAGKTSLVASWLAARGQRVVWYQVDPGDRDPATLFHYLGIAAQGLGRAPQRPLPHFTPEYHGGLREFTRRHFQALFSRLAVPCAVVFDNCHAAGGDAPLEQILAWAMSEVPARVALVCISRSAPGEALAGRLADTALVRIGADDLRLDEREARAIARSRGYRSSAGSAVLGIVRGWAAGLVLTLRAKAQGIAPALGAGDARHPLFEYFAGEIFAAAGAETRGFLMHAALLPVMSPHLVERLTGRAGAGQVLEDLHRGHFFTERRISAGGDSSYEFHPLFRDFLLSRARETFGVEGFSQRCRQAAALLAPAGQVEAAAALLAEGRDWPALARLIGEQARTLMQQGRWRTLIGWIASVPADVVAESAWLTYWRGACLCFTDAAAARDALEAAYGMFEASGEGFGAALACTGVIQTYAWGAMTPALGWIARLEEALARILSPPIELELAVIDCMLGVLFAQPLHPMIRTWARRALELIRTPPAGRHRARLFGFTVWYQLFIGDFGAARALLAQLERAGDDAESPLGTITAHLAMCAWAYQNAEHDIAFDALRKAQAFASETGVHIMDADIAIQQLYASLSARDLARAEEALAHLLRVAPPHRSATTVHGDFMHAGLLLARGDRASALATALPQLAAAEDLGMRFGINWFRFETAQMLLLDGQHEAARALLVEVTAFAHAMPSSYMLFAASLMLAIVHSRAGEEGRAMAALREALAIGRRHNYMNCHPWWIPELMSELCGKALRHGIETDYVRRLIGKRALEPGASAPETWPWPIRIHALGRFELVRDGVPVKSGGKAQQRVLDLLKAIVAFGPRGAASDTIASALWPASDGDAAQTALDVTLHRLRKLLELEGAVVVADGRIALNPRCCWVDAFAFEQALDACERDGGELAEAERALALYAGHFLQGDEETPWLLPRRERLRSKFLRCVERCGATREERGEHPAAVELYRRALEVDPLAEGVYRNLMAAYLAAGRRAEALEAYRRCRHMLSVVLGVPPSAETEAMRARVSANR